MSGMQRLEQWARSGPDRNISVVRRGELVEIKASELERNACMTIHPQATDLAAAFVLRHMDCGHNCEYVEPYGFTIEEGCPVHDSPIK